MKGFGLIAIALIAVLLGSWVTNLFKLTDCDFVAPYKCEAIHAAGLIPPVALVTAWIGSDK